MTKFKLAEVAALTFVAAIPFIPAAFVMYEQNSNRSALRDTQERIASDLKRPSLYKAVQNGGVVHQQYRAANGRTIAVEYSLARDSQSCAVITADIGIPASVEPIHEGGAYSVPNSCNHSRQTPKLG